MKPEIFKGKGHLNSTFTHSTGWETLYCAKYLNLLANQCINYNNTSMLKNSKAEIFPLFLGVKNQSVSEIFKEFCT